MRIQRKIPAPAVVAIALALVGSVASGQEPQPASTPTFGEEVDVAEVLLDVLVTDADGNVIVGLGEDDFEVTEDGRPVDLTEVTFYSNRPRLDEAGRKVEAPLTERYFVLFFHDLRDFNEAGLTTRRLDAARKAREWVASLQLDDYVAVASYATSLVVHADFTRDREELDRAIRDAATGKTASGNWPSRQPPEGQPSLLRNLPRGEALIDATTDVREAIEELAHAVQPLVGRKNLVLFSGGFGRIDNFRNYVPDPRYEKPMQEALNDANVAVYAVDLFPPGTRHPLSNSLSLIANQTGGRYFHNFVNFATPLEQIAAETSGYYLLAYRSPHPRGESGFQEVDVAVRNPGFRVTARRGYRYGPGEG